MEQHNIALGECRASAVREYMRSLGLNSSRVSITSVGERDGDWHRRGQLGSRSQRHPERGIVANAHSNKHLGAVISGSRSP